MSKKGFSKKDVHFLFFLFLSFFVGKSKKENMKKKNMEKENFKKNPEK